VGLAGTAASTYEGRATEDNSAVAISVARPSVVSLLLQPRAAGGAALGTATGFVVERSGTRYLVTNWHVVSGRRPDTGAVLSASGEVPTELIVVHNVAGALGSWVTRVEPLYEPGGAPLWREHATHGRAVDVVALPLSQLAGVDIHAYDPWSAGLGLAAGIASGVSIVGFPFGVTGGGAMGIWVRGWIASEPASNYNDLPCFLVDSRTRPGQSGSPVIVFHSGGAVPMADGSTSIFAGAVEQFLGVYSGRINDQSDLGFVWKAVAIREIVDGGAPGTV
jgi:trypsin-like peptidase